MALSPRHAASWALAAAATVLLLAAPATAVTQFVGDVDGFGIVPAGLTAANGNPADTDGDGIIEAGELLPDRNGNGSTSGPGGGDSFDNRSAAESSASNGAQNTDYAVEGQGNANGMQFVFNFTVPTAGTPGFGIDHFINAPWKFDCGLRHQSLTP